MLQAVLAGAAPTRYFIPFPRDQHLGRVVAFDPPKVELSTKLRENSQCLEKGTLRIFN